MSLVVGAKLRSLGVGVKPGGARSRWDEQSATHIIRVSLEDTPYSARDGSHEKQKAVSASSPLDR